VTQPIDDWDAVLDAFAERLAAQWAALTARQPVEVADFEPPEGLGPLPARLKERAAELVAEAEAALKVGTPVPITVPATPPASGSWPPQSPRRRRLERCQ
jgi:hypothetical protein